MEKEKRDGYAPACQESTATRHGHPRSFRKKSSNLPSALPLPYFTAVSARMQLASHHTRGQTKFQFNNFFLLRLFFFSRCTPRSAERRSRLVTGDGAARISGGQVRAEQPAWLPVKAALANAQTLNHPCGGPLERPQRKSEKNRS